MKRIRRTNTHTTRCDRGGVRKTKRHSSSEEKRQTIDESPPFISAGREFIYPQCGGLRGHRMCVPTKPQLRVDTKLEMRPSKEYKGKEVSWNSVWRETVAGRRCNRTDHSVFYDTRCSPLFHAKRCFISPPFLGTSLKKSLVSLRTKTLGSDSFFSSCVFAAWLKPADFFTPGDWVDEKCVNRIFQHFSQWFSNTEKLIIFYRKKLPNPREKNACVTCRTLLFLKKFGTFSSKIFF